MPPKKTAQAKNSPRSGSKPASSGSPSTKGASKGKGGARAPSKLRKTKRSESNKSSLNLNQLPHPEVPSPKVFQPFEPPHPYNLIPDSTETRGLQGRHLCTHPGSETPHIFVSFCIEGLEEGPKNELKQRYNTLKTFRHENLRTYKHFFDQFLTSSGAVSDYIAASCEQVEPEGHTLKEVCSMYQSKGQIICESILWDITAQLFTLLAIMHSPLGLEVKGGVGHSSSVEGDYRSPPIPHGNLSLSTIMCSYSSRSDYELTVGLPLLSGYSWDSGVSSDEPASLVLVTPEDDIRAVGSILHELATFSEAGNIPVTYSSSFQSLLRSLTSKEPTKPLPSASEILLLREVQGIIYRRTAPSEQKLHDLLSKTSLKVDNHTEPDIEQTVPLDASVSPDEDGNTPLHLAVKEARIDDLAKLKGYAGRRNKKGETALMIAVEMDAIDVVRELAPLESNCFLLNGTTALSLALELEHLECAAILLKYEGVDNRAPNIDSNGVTNLMRAAENDDIVGVWSWLPRQCKYADNQGQTAFMRAAATGNLKLCKLLMQSEAGMRDLDGRTALMHYAISGGSVSLDEYEAYHLTYPNTDISLDTSILCSQSSSRSVPPLVDNTLRSTTALSTSVLSVSTDLRRLKRSRFHQQTPVNSELLQLLCSLEGKLTDKNGRNALYLAIAVNNMETALALVPYEGPEPVYVKELSCKDSQLEQNQDGAVYTDVDSFHLCSLDKYPSGFTDLMDAVLENDVYRAFCFMQTQSKRFDSSGFSALMYACQNNRPMLCRLLAIEEAKLQAYVHTNPNNFYSCNKTALMVAAEAGHIECVRILASREARLTDSENKTALMYAASNGHEEVVMELLQRECGMNAGRFNATSYAIMNGHYKLANILLASEKDTDANYIQAAEQLRNSSSSAPTTPLMLAAKAGDVSAVYNLRNQYLKMVDMHGMTALLYACEFGCRYCIHLLKDEAQIYRKADGLTPRALAEEHHLVDCYDDLPPIPVKDNRGNTQLHRAVLENDSINLRRYCHLAKELNAAGLTSLMLAAERNNIEAASLLADREGGITAKRYKVTNLLWTEVTAMMIAAAQGHHEIVQKLVSKEAKMCEKTEGRTALMAAAALGKVDVVRILSTHESRIQKHDGWSALMYAAAYGYEECIDYLLGEARLTANDGWTALMCAAKNGHSSIVRQLIDHEKGMLKSKKYPALYYAVVSGHLGCVKLLLPHEYVLCKAHIMNEVRARKGVPQETLTELSQLLQSQEFSTMCNQNDSEISDALGQTIIAEDLNVVDNVVLEK